ncbi:hypothetical protein CY35_01G041400 [Sphagnum magellanicum]|nr:hypothetical protein CY35_01G041400 [Sphagnum magellanicum]KAH9574156.1 hypothetical protein CY35_01G041400 [Sphagnum magellanicum]KAH9574157.1 hypothetical protein CY35_01G041400 [Sphagnum magellanicum]KAH9574158.1 hypothetical protein CY35_01G041400 [Sphagnum magellanicum]KAH9574159.1 hypothetical protein CY35_01G041400 [Sphagnum magellanicum]
MEEIVPNTDNIDIEGQTSNLVSHMAEGQGNSDTEEQIANFISEEQTSQWFNEFKTTFQRHEVREVRNDVLVKKLPACYRVPLDQYNPYRWHFGLHNRDVLHTSESEDLKIALAAACELGPWDEFCASVVDDPLGVLRAYGLDHSEPKFSMRQIQCLLTLDALTIFLVFVNHTYNDIFDESTQIGARLTALLKPCLEYRRIYNDLFLFENQIPMALLRKVISTCYEKLIGLNLTLMDQQLMLDMILKANVSDMCERIFVLTKDHLAKIEKAYPQGELEKCPHIVACVYRILCGENLKSRSGGTMITMPSATALKKAGIQIKAIEGMLDEVGFRKRCLFLPIVKLYDPTEARFRNLAMYGYVEVYNSVKCPFGEYLKLMTDLIKELGDVKHLIECGVIQNKLGNDNNAFKMWNSLQSDLFLPKYSKEYGDMVSEINKQCKSSLNVMRTEFYQLFCSRPWYVIGVITATIVTVGTCIQAYTSVIASDKMQPHFPP